MDWILEHFHVDDLDGDGLIVEVVFALEDLGGIALADDLVHFVTVVGNHFLLVGRHVVLDLGHWTGEHLFFERFKVEHLLKRI